MGNILRIFISNQCSKTPISPKLDFDVKFDFENCEPSENEYRIWRTIQDVLDRCDEFLEIVQNYVDNRQLEQSNIKNPDDVETERELHDSLRTCVLKLYDVFLFCDQIAGQLVDLMAHFYKTDQDCIENLKQSPAMFKQFAQILIFILDFDNAKARNFQITNDVGALKRIEAKMRARNTLKEETLDNAEFTRMQLFYAANTPLLNYCVHQLNGLQASYTINEEAATSILGAIANISARLLTFTNDERVIDNTETRKFITKIMTAVIIFFDTFDSRGVFQQPVDKIDIKECLRVLKTEKEQDLMNIIKYCAKHLNDDSTSKQIKAFFQ